jgi:hypothetical protein
MIKLHYFIALAGVWALGNGILHDVFILLQRRPFDKDLIRLMIDGHILIFSGILYLLCYNGIREQQTLAYLVTLAAAVFLLGYCALIFKILPSILTIVINLMVLVWVIMDYPTGK